MRALALLLALLLLAGPAAALPLEVRPRVPDAPVIALPSEAALAPEPPVEPPGIAIDEPAPAATVTQPIVEHAPALVELAPEPKPATLAPTYHAEGALGPDERAPTPAPPPLARIAAVDEPTPLHPFAPAAARDARPAAQPAPDATIAKARAPDVREGRGSEVRLVALSLLFLLLAPWALYHRLRGGALLRHGTRARALAHLRAQPGATPADVARALCVDPSTALYHLRRLVRDGLAVAEGPRRDARYFEAGAHAAPERTRIVAASDAAPVLQTVRAQPGASKAHLAQELGIARPTLSWHLARLRAAGLVREERDGRSVRVYPI